MTLIELLIVIVILTTIVGAAIPLMSPSNDDRRLREAARTLNTYITGAQTRAIATKRPYGIALKRLSSDTNTNPTKHTPVTALDQSKNIHPDNGACLEVFYIEQPTPYAGFDANSRACVAIHPTRPGYVLVRFVARVPVGSTTGLNLPPGYAVDLFPGGTIRPGDVIEINGTRFKLLPDITDSFANNVKLDVLTNTLTFFAAVDPNSVTKPTTILAEPINDSGQQINPRHDNNGFELGSKAPPVPPPFWAQPSPYKVLRQPTPASDEPYQLPEGTAIDLRASGVGSGDYFYVPNVHDNDQDVIIMFTPEGRVARVSFSTLPTAPIDTLEGNVEVYDQPTVDNLYLLVGRRENIEPPSLASDQTLQSSIIGVTLEDDRAKLRAKINWLGGSSRWIVIGSQSGRIVTVENAFVDMATLYTQYTSSPYNLLPGSDALRNQQILAAREFTREMAQLSGK